MAFLAILVPLAVTPAAADHLHVDTETLNGWSEQVSVTLCEVAPAVLHGVTSQTVAAGPQRWRKPRSETFAMPQMRYAKLVPLTALLILIHGHEGKRTHPVGWKVRP